MHYKLYLVILFTLFSGVMLKTENCSAQWTQMSSGMGNIQDVYALTASGTNIVAGTWGSGVYRSADNGSNWIQTALNTQSVYCLASSGNYVYAGTDSTGLFVSSNNGISWTQNGFVGMSVECLAANGNTVFAGTWQNGVYISTNNGLNWTQTSLYTRTIWSITVSGNNVYAGTNNNGVYVSTNNGATWTQSSLNTITVWSLAMIGTNLFAGIQTGGIYLSTNNGSTWSQTAMNNQTVYALCVNGTNLFAGTELNGVFLTTNNGTSWLDKNQGFAPAPDIGSLLIANNYVFAGTYGRSAWRRTYTEAIGIKQISETVPSTYSLKQNYPNPFNPTTNIKFDLVKNSFVNLTILDVSGREIETLVNEKLGTGTYEVNFNASKYPSGTYFYKLETDNFSGTKKMILLK
ncbi:MAG: T9SS type A sorting domain-containing protein [Ignavibacteriae bacterium]|nr:T9SS type A sorting domain-containing protein [Ignavibacteriota bacterium]